MEFIFLDWPVSYAASVIHIVLSVIHIVHGNTQNTLKSTVVNRFTTETPDSVVTN